MDLSILKKRNAFLELAADKLGKASIDFCEKADFIKKEKNTWAAAGVLMPLTFGEQPESASEWRLLLIKRSSVVAQAGDLSCPGGMLERLDFRLRPFVASRLLPIMKGKPLQYARARGLADFKNITLFLANALRESWEEVSLSPFHVRFLGPLPCRNLVMFTKTIFPVVGFVDKPWRLKPNHEVEKIVDIPLRHFFESENYALFAIETVNGGGNAIGPASRFPCFIHRDEEGEEEILWGATFSIVLNFLKTVFDFTPPEPTSEWVLRKMVRPNYMGNRNKANRKP